MATAKMPSRPAPQAVDGEKDLWRALAAMSPQLVAYLMSFLTLGIFWAGQQVQPSQLARCDRHLAWIYIAFLFAISLMPFSTRLLAEFIHYRTALLCYWGGTMPATPAWSDPICPPKRAKPSSAASWRRRPSMPSGPRYAC